MMTTDGPPGAERTLSPEVPPGTVLSTPAPVVAPDPFPVPAPVPAPVVAPAADVQAPVAAPAPVAPPAPVAAPAPVAPPAPVPAPAPVAAPSLLATGSEEEPTFTLDGQPLSMGDYVKIKTQKLMEEQAGQAVSANGDAPADDDGPPGV